MDPNLLDSYFDHLRTLALSAEFSDRAGTHVRAVDGIEWAVKKTRHAHDAGNKLMFIGNGGSAGIASHVAIDYSKNGNLRSLAFNDGASLTCLANDLGYENVFAKQVQIHGRPGDVLIAISSGGGSKNILNAAQAARDMGVTVFTLSGFKADNPLRRLGDLNAFVASDQYGFVEIVHLTLLHAVLDFSMGWDGRVLGQGPLPPVCL
ncbi:MAG: phosphoheptose isomerase [Alphaproteobacteria bacterium RIFOXYD12_FULL_60_8]|nr:MAG: phosphoheptose isomerase [Alphaproteobacteria bacterium RIFOXYD12_FULL_60_8]